MEMHTAVGTPIAQEENAVYHELRCPDGISGI